MTSDFTKSLDDPQFLGDGLYCGNDGWLVWVWTSDGLSVTAGPLAFEPETLAALVDYNRRIRGITSRV